MFFDFFLIKENKKGNKVKLQNNFFVIFFYICLYHFLRSQKIPPFSMEKLYDLMVMCFKYQLFHTRSAEEVHAITLNHLDSLERMVSNPKTFFENKPGCVENFTKVQVPRKSSESENLQNNSSLLIRSTKQNFINYYSKYNNIEYDFIRNCLNKLFEKSLTRISMFLRSNVQDEKGKFIYSKTFDNKLSEKFNLLNRNVVDVCFRGSKLGYSLYHIFGRGVVESSEDHHHHDQRQDTNREIKSNNLNSHSSNNTSRTSHRSSIAIDEILAISQLQILENTIGSQKNEEEFTPDLFDDEIDSAGLLWVKSCVILYFFIERRMMKDIIFLLFFATNIFSFIFLEIMVSTENSSTEKCLSNIWQFQVGAGRIFEYLFL